MALSLQEEEDPDSPMDVGINDNLLPEESVDLSPMSIQEETVVVPTADERNLAKLECHGQFNPQGFAYSTLQQSEEQYVSQELNRTGEFY